MGCLVSYILIIVHSATGVFFYLPVVTLSNEYIVLVPRSLLRSPAEFGSRIQPNRKLILVRDICFPHYDVTYSMVCIQHNFCSVCIVYFACVLRICSVCMRGYGLSPASSYLKLHFVINK